MTEKESDYLKQLNFILEQLVDGKCITELPSFECESDNEDILALNETVKQLTWQYQSSFDFIMNLAKGNLDVDPPRKNSLANHYKTLHAELRHLTWQLEQIARGNYNQPVYFMGQFSKAVNNMSQILMEKERLSIENKKLTDEYRLLAENTVESIWLYDLTNARTRYVSPSIAKLRGIPAEKAQEESIEQALTNDSFTEISQLLKENYASTEEHVTKGFKIQKTINFRQQHADGRVLDIESSVNIFKNEEDDAILALGVSRDITKRKNLERQLQQKTLELEYLNRSKDTFFSIIAHDLRNPFNGLIGMSQLLTENLKNNNTKEALEMASIIHDSSEQGYNLLSNLLDWARINNGRLEIKVEPLCLNDLIKETIALMIGNAKEKEIDISIIPGATFCVEADKNMLGTVIRNLLSNAIKFTPNRGKIELSSYSENNFAHISVTDNGVGLSENDQKKLFLIDSRIKHPGTNNETGTGLGLILCREFLTRMGGDINVQSTQGKGTTFTFTVPLTERKTTSSSHESTCSQLKCH